MDYEALVIITLCTLVIPMSWIFGMTWLKSWRRRLERDSAPPDEWLGELEQLRGRVAELEERVDFTERLLARQRDPERIPGGEA